MRTSFVATALLLVLAGGPSAGADAASFKDELKKFRAGAKSPSFFQRVRAHETLAKTGDKRALDTLVRSYGKQKEPKAQAQHLLAASCAEHFNRPEFLTALARWRTKYGRRDHAWLWYQTLLVHAQQEGPEELIAVARSNKSAYLRAAAVEALADLRMPEAAAVVPAVVDALPADPAERAAMINCLATVLLSLSHEDGSSTHHGLAREMMDLLDAPNTPMQSRVVIARTLQRVFDVPYAFLKGDPWRQVLASVQSLMEIPQLRGAQVRPVKLAGVEARGKHICYLLDYSHGASAAATDNDVAILEGKDTSPSGVNPAESGMTRVLAMRNAVVESIKGLKPDQSFAVIYHRHLDTAFVPGCKGMAPATPKNVAAVLKGLKTVVPEADSDLHAGLMHAFAVTEKGRTKNPAYTDATAMLEGCDTVFVVTQSGAMRDTWVPAGDAPDEPLRWSHEDRQMRGIYSDELYLAQEVKRWNLFRKAQIHVVGVGDAPMEALQVVFGPYRGWNTMKIRESEAADAEAAQGAFAAVQRQYEAYLKRPSLFMRMRGRQRLARTRDRRALDILAQSYALPEAPEDRVPHILISLCSRHFGKAEHLPRFQQWRAAHTKPEDAWLWFKTAQLDLRFGDASTVETLARSHAQHYLRLGAARAIASMRKPNCVPLAADLLAALPPKGPARASTLESVAALLEANKDARGEAAFGAPAERLIEYLKDSSVPLRTRQTIARHFARIFGTDMGYGLDWRKWLRELKGAQAVPETPKDEQPDVYAPFEFIGIPSAGGRVCYVIDASDSMLTPITGEERKRLSQVVTGAGGKPKKNEALPWHRINTRFDVAREYLKLSLEKLTEDKFFAIVFFGTRAELLKSTPSLVPATPKAVQRAIRELDAIKAGDKKPDRPHGTLRGFTNMHGGLKLAFRITDKGVGAQDPYVDPKMLTAGVDTVFLLSDGVPSMDDYARIDRPDPGDAQADPETLAKQEKVPDVTFHGPYVEFDGFLLDDVLRMNLFRNAAIHCIGIGECDMVLLRQIAAAGLGDTKRLGKD